MASKRTRVWEIRRWATSHGLVKTPKLLGRLPSWTSNFSYLDKGSKFSELKRNCLTLTTSCHFAWLSTTAELAWTHLVRFFWNSLFYRNWLIKYQISLNLLSINCFRQIHNRCLTWSLIHLSNIWSCLAARETAHTSVSNVTNQASFHTQLKENVLKHEWVSKVSERDSRFRNPEIHFELVVFPG